MDKELHLHKRVDICEEQTIYKLRQLSACDRDWRPAWLQPGQRLITGPGVERSSGGEKESSNKSNGNSNWQQLQRCRRAERRKEEEAGQGRESGQVLHGIYLISSCPRKNLGIFNRMSLNFMCVLPHRWGVPRGGSRCNSKIPSSPS